MTLHFPADWVPPSARSNAGLFRADQAVAAGMTAAQVRRRRDTGRWVRVVGDALALAAQPIDPWQLAHGAWLTWPDAAVCLTTAARVHRLPVDDDGAVHVLVPSPRAARGRLTPHEFRVEPSEITRLGHARVTDLRRTIFDCLGRLDDRRSEQLMIWVVTRELLSRDDLELAVARNPGRWGNSRRRRALDDTRTGALGAGERRLHALLTSAGITGWLADQRVFDDVGLVGRADVLFAGVGLVIEIDGLAYRLFAVRGERSHWVGVHAA
ncbi:MAG: type IV toxin-antitoxin system AbiEi family antitoxin domain-containing protein, partial [Cellulomonas sp.]